MLPLLHSKSRRKRSLHCPVFLNLASPNTMDSPRENPNSTFIMSTHQNNTRSPRARINNYLEDTLETVLSQLTLSEDGDNQNATITLKRRAANANTLFRIDPSTGALGSIRAETTVAYSFPGKDGYEAWRFSETLSPSMEAS